MKNKNLKSIIIALVVFIPPFFGYKYFKFFGVSSESLTHSSIEELYKNRQSEMMVEFEGMVIKVLSDDTTGSRHQRFIVRVSNKHTVLVAHNIDVAPRIPIESNRKINIYGQYEWNKKGGVVHWTHADDNGVHESG